MNIYLSAKNLIQKKRVRLLIGVIIIIPLAILFSSSTFLLNPNTAIKPTPSTIQIPKDFPLPNPEFPGYSKSYIREAEKIASRESEQLKRDYLVGKLIDKLPYSGINFSFSFDIKRAEFILALRKGYETQGKIEFNSFLKENEVADQSWIRNLNNPSN